MEIRTVATFLASVFFLAGCASYNYTDAPPSLGMMYSKYAYIGYDGDLLGIEDVGVVTTDGLIKVKSVDGKSISALRSYKTSGIYSGGRFQLHLLPGVHTLVLTFSDNRGGGTISWSTSDVTKSISINKGQIIHFWLSQTGRTWDAKQSDGASAFGTIASDYRELINAK
jgi:hypothetical protein